jgi:beta-N-acetylhexosaminidase
MTETRIHNLKSIVTQLALLILCIYGMQLINVERTVIKIKENIVRLNELGIQTDTKNLIPTLQQKLSLNFNTINQSSKEIETLIDTNTKKLNSRVDINKTKIESMELILQKLNILKKQDLGPSSNTKVVIDNQNKILKDYSTTLKEYQKTHSNSNPLWGIIKNELFDKVNKMTVEELVGQLFVIGVDGTTLSEEEKNGITNFKPGGIILMGKNVVDNGQLKSLTDQLKSTNTSYPLLIATDQEGGDVKRINWENIPPQNTWANENNTKLCEYGNTRADILTQAGINLNFAPVVDLGNNDAAFINSRTISTDPNTVSNKIRDYRECFDKKIMSTLKHFPGHGTVTADSHTTVPSNPNITKAQWDLTHAEPFLKNIDAAFIMSSHIVLDKIDTKSASMSSIWLNDILKKEYGYKGLVITDDMQQFANISNSDMNQSAIDAVTAGNDMILYVPNYTTVQPIKDNLVKHFSTKRNVAEAMVLKILMAKSLIL